MSHWVVNYFISKSFPINNLSLPTIFTNQSFVFWKEFLDKIDLFPADFWHNLKLDFKVNTVLFDKSALHMLHMNFFAIVKSWQKQVLVFKNVVCVQMQF